MGAEIGIATGKMHARGPVGAEQLTSFKYLVTGDGTVRRLTEMPFSRIFVLTCRPICRAAGCTSANCTSEARTSNSAWGLTAIFHSVSSILMRSPVPERFQASSVLVIKILPPQGRVFFQTLDQKECQFRFGTRKILGDAPVQS